MKAWARCDTLAARGERKIKYEDIQDVKSADVKAAQAVLRVSAFGGCVYMHEVERMRGRFRTFKFEYGWKRKRCIFIVQ